MHIVLKFQIKIKYGLDIWTLCMSIYNWNQNNIMPESLVEVIRVCKVYDSCEQTLDSFNKFYMWFNHGWLNEPSIMMTATNQHISKQETIFVCCNLLSRVSLLLHTRQKVVMVKMQDYPKLLIGAHRISFWLHLSSYGGFPL